MATSEITISTCPVCGKTHSYDLSHYDIPIEAVAVIQKPLQETGKSPKTLIFNCPSQPPAQFQADVRRLGPNEPIEVSNLEAVSPNNAALISLGTQLITNSLTVSSTFATTMIGISTGAVGVYTGLFAIILPQTSSLAFPEGLLAVIPALLFILASAGFAYCAFPRFGLFVLADPQSIDAFHTATFNSRKTWVIISFILFSVAILGAVIVIVWLATAYRHHA